MAIHNNRSSPPEEEAKLHGVEADLVAVDDLEAPEQRVLTVTLARAVVL